MGRLLLRLEIVVELLNVANAGVLDFALRNLDESAARNAGPRSHLRPSVLGGQKPLDHVVVDVGSHASVIDPIEGPVNPL